MARIPGQIRAGVTAWWVEVERPDEYGIDGLLNDLFDKLRPGWPKLVEMGQSLDAHVTVSVEPHGSMPSLFMSRRIVASLAELNAYISIGVSPLVEEASEE